MPDQNEPTLPTPELCALMAYEHLKDNGQSLTSMAWTLLGLLCQTLDEDE